MWTQFYNTAVIGVYELNKSEYIMAFCENQDEPELKCDGKCHLSKQLVDVNQEPTESEPPALIPEQELFAQSIDFSLNTVLIEKIQIPFNSSLYKDIVSSRLEHPPKV